MARGYSGSGGTVKFGEGAASPSNLTAVLVKDFSLSQSQASAEATPLASTTGMAYVPAGPITSRVSINGWFRPTALLRAYTAHGCVLTLGGFTDSLVIVTDYTLTMTRASADVTRLSDTLATRWVPSAVVDTRLSASIIWDPNSSENPIVAGATYGTSTITFTDAGPCVGTITADEDTNTGVYVESFDVSTENNGTHTGSIELVCSGNLFGFAPSFTNPITQGYGKLEMTYSDATSYTAPATVDETENVGAYCEEFTISGSRGGNIESTLTYVLSGERFP